MENVADDTVAIVSHDTSWRLLWPSQLDIDPIPLWKSFGTPCSVEIDCLIRRTFSINTRLSEVAGVAHRSL
ncbi:MAG TPA: hypothetical protein QF694_06510 [Dehalococcoidia bacterium]|nr:hypothetical protein [Chloroflexota bacterium]MDP6057032.1 hypothetical protein [Dehalococcoidia bacterium]MDP7090674.1 hypothetical protein [Dehalococcoidia bacterium]MDP7262765.1 hypothetical protein [Dehalococcoidia bacterium]MDP7485801.1 hypothetical protein [Dehalococcoidia bacterium]